MTAKSYDKKCARLIQEAAREDGKEASYCFCLNLVRADMAKYLENEPAAMRASRIYLSGAVK